MNALYRLSAALIAAISFANGAAWAQQPDPHADDRAKLRAMLAEFEAAINAQSIDRMVAEMADDVTVIWLNAEVSRGKDEVRAYYGRMVGHDKAILSKYLTKASLGAPALEHFEMGGIADLVRQPGELGDQGAGRAAAHLFQQRNRSHQRKPFSAPAGMKIAIAMPSLRHTVNDSAPASKIIDSPVAVAAPQSPIQGINAIESATFSASVSA